MNIVNVNLTTFTLIRTFNVIINIVNVNLTTIIRTFNVIINI